MKTLEFRDVGLQKGSFALQHVSFAVDEQEIVAVLGRTGAGKTLLLESAAGFYTPCQGQVLLDGQPVTAKPLPERRIGFVYQDYALFPHLSVEQNIAYGLRVRHVERSEVTERVRATAAMLGIGHLLQQSPGTLSGGEKQRCALARTLILNPRLLLLDEPFSALDPATKNTLYAAIRAIPQRFNCAILFVTHDFHEAQRLASRIGIMADGRLLSVRRAEELFRPSANPTLNEFLGLPVNGEKICSGVPSA